MTVGYTTTGCICSTTEHLWFHHFKRLTHPFLLRIRQPFLRQSKGNGSVRSGDPLILSDNTSVDQSGQATYEGDLRRTAKSQEGDSRHQLDTDGAEAVFRIKRVVGDVCVSIVPVDRIAAIVSAAVICGETADDQCIAVFMDLIDRAEATQQRRGFFDYDMMLFMGEGIVRRVIGTVIHTSTGNGTADEYQHQTHNGCQPHEWRFGGCLLFLSQPDGNTSDRPEKTQHYD